MYKLGFTACTTCVQVNSSSTRSFLHNLLVDGLLHLYIIVEQFIHTTFHTTALSIPLELNFYSHHPHTLLLK